MRLQTVKCEKTIRFPRRIWIDCRVKSNRFWYKTCPRLNDGQINQNISDQKIEIPVRLLFESPTVADMAATILLKYAKQKNGKNQIVYQLIYSSFQIKKQKRLRKCYDFICLYGPSSDLKARISKISNNDYDLTYATLPKSIYMAPIKRRLSIKNTPPSQKNSKIFFCWNNLQPGNKSFLLSALIFQTVLVRILS